MDRQCWLSGRSRAAPAPGEPAPRAAYRPQAGYGATPGALTQLLPAWPAGHPGCALSWSAPTSRVHTPRTVAEQSRDGRRPAPCLSTASQSSIREKTTLERKEGSPNGVGPFPLTSPLSLSCLSDRNGYNGPSLGRQTPPLHERKRCA